MDEVDFLRQLGHDLRELHVEFVLRDLDGLVDPPDGLFQESQVAVFRSDDLLPVPLVDIDGMDVVEVLVGPQGVHVGVDAATGPDAELGQLDAFPFGQGVNDFGFPLVHAPDREGDGALHAVEVVVEAGPGEDDHGRRDPQQGELGGEIDLEHVLDGLDGFFRLLGAAKQVAVMLGKIQGHTRFRSFQSCKDTPHARNIQLCSPLSLICST